MLDQRDKVMLENLFHNARLTTKQLAKRIKTTQPAAYKRLKNLEKEGYISRYDSIVNWQALPFIKIVYFCNDLKVSEIIKQKCCFGIQEMIGEFRYLVWCFFKNRKMQNQFERLLPKKHKKVQISTAEFSGMSIFGISPEKTKEEIHFTEQNLSSEDVKIMHSLSEGGARKTIREISDKTGISMDIVWQRKKKLIKSGYFMHFFAQPGELKLELTITYLFFNTKKTIKNTPNNTAILLKTKNGYGMGLINQNHSSYLSALDSTFSQFQDLISDPVILTVKKAILLNRYPFEFLLK